MAFIVSTDVSVSSDLAYSSVSFARRQPWMHRNTSPAISAPTTASTISV